MSYDIHLISARAKLEPRDEPYWGPPLGSGKYIGVRKRQNGTCSWVARHRNDEGKQLYKTLGQVTNAFEHAAAKKAAEEWFADLDVGVVNDKPITVEDACKDYVEDLEAEGRLDTAHDVKKRFERLVYEHSIGKIQVQKLRTLTIKKWRDGMGGAKSSQNRNHAALNAALNLAVTHQKVNAAVAQQWKAVKMHEKATGRRTLFLDLKQRRALRDNCEGAIRNLIEGAMFTGARPGELVSMNRSQYDSRTKSATFTGKTGSRTVPLSPDAVTLFDRLAKDKLPTAFMFTRDDGKQWAHSDWDELVREAATKAELPKGVVLYTLRHSFVSESLQAGLPSLDVARLTGTSLQMIESHYGHLIQSAARERLAGVVLI